MKCGDVLLIQFPFTDTAGSKLRPALIVSADGFNRSEDRVFVPISSVLRPNDPFVYPISKAHRAFVESGLKCDSFVKWTKPTALSTKVVQRRLGTIDPVTLAEIRERIRSVFQ